MVSVVTSVPVHACQAAFSDFSVLVFIGAIWTFTYKNVCGMSVGQLLQLPSYCFYRVLQLASCRLNLTPSTEDSLAHGES
jgi:hypothetical protein